MPMLLRGCRIVSWSHTSLLTGPFGVIVTEFAVNVNVVLPTVPDVVAVRQACTSWNVVLTIADADTMEHPSPTVMVTGVVETSAGWTDGLIVTAAAGTVLSPGEQDDGSAGEHAVAGGVACQAGHARPPPLKPTHMR